MEANLQRKPRRPRADGERTRAAILTEATALATLHGLEGLSIGRLAELTGMSKSGLFAHFGSKEKLQLAVVATAAKCAQAEYTGPALVAGTPLERLWEFCDHFLSFVERRVFPGGCFFASAGTKVHGLPEPVKARILRYQRAHKHQLAQGVAEAIRTGELKTELHPKQVAFEINALTIGANTNFILHGDPEVLDQAWEGVCRLLGDPARPRRRRRPV